MSKISKRYIWTDIETFGLVPSICPILEVGFIITDGQLNPIDEIEILIWDGDFYEQQCELLVQEAANGSKGSQWVLDQHTKSNLWRDARAVGVQSNDASTILCTFLDKHEVNKEPLAGSSVHFDREFLSYWMPDIISYFSHRNIDISSLKEIYRRRVASYNRRILLPPFPAKRSKHRSLPDIEDTIAEARWYFDNFLAF